MPQRNNNTFIIIVLCIFALLFFISLCRHSSTSNPAQPPAASDNSNMLLGNPTNAAQSSSNEDNYLIDHTYYTESYNSRRGEPNWVSWHIGAQDLGSVDRIDDFRPDNNLPGGWFAVSPNNYRNSGFDKGHNCPSGDRTASREANSSTFLMDNIVPQAPRNNEQTWEHFESYCRDQVQKGNEVYVVMGCYGQGGTGKNGYKTVLAGGKITVPSNIWKVAVFLPDGNNDLARINNNTRIIAINTPNDNNISPNWMNYVTTVSDIEKNCSCNLLSALPANLQQSLESKAFRGGN